MSDRRVLRSPLAELRASVGQSHREYAQLVANTHAALGYGRMAARREKVSRWESGRIAPELTAQLTIAHIHKVPQAEVLRLGWPDWLYLATGAQSSVGLPWTPEATAQALREGARARPTRPQSFLVVTGSAITTLIRDWLAALDNSPAPVRSGRLIHPDTIGALATRVGALSDMETRLSPGLLDPVAHAECQLLAQLLGEVGYDEESGVHLHLLASRISHLCSRLNYVTGNQAGAERLLLAAVRAATTAGAPQAAAALMATLAGQHMDIGEPRDGFALANAAWAVARRMAPSHRLIALLHICEARGYARLGAATTSACAFSAAAGALARGATTEQPPTADWVTMETLELNVGASLLDLGQPARALDHLEALTTPTQDSGLTPGLRALYMPRLVEAQLAVGDVEAALHSARNTVCLLEHAHSDVTRQFRHMFAPYCANADVHAFLDLCAASSSSHLHEHPKDAS